MVQKSEIKEVRIELQNGRDYQLKMIFTDNEGVVDTFKHMFEPQILLMYHCLARECNEKFGTHFGYDDNVINRCSSALGYHENKYNYKYVISSRLDNYYFNIHAEFINCGLNSGIDYCFKWSKERLISFVRELDMCLCLTDVHKLSYEGEKGGFLYHYKIGIGSTIHSYYEDLCREDKDLKGIRISYRKM